jgi:hypothetical protein
MIPIEKRSKDLKYYYRNREKISKRTSERYFKNHEKNIEKNRINYLENREKILEYKRIWRRNHREEFNRKIREKRASKKECASDYLKRRYGISKEEYVKLFNSQNGVCAICGESEKMTGSKGTQRLAVDHSHKNNAIRGLLCRRCNVSLGLFNDNIKLLENVINYLRKYV